MLKGLKVMRPVGSKPTEPKKWQQDYSDVVTKEQLTKQHELIFNLFAEGELNQLKVAQASLVALQKLYFDQSAEPSQKELFRLEGQPATQIPASNPRFSTSKTAYEQERTNNKQKRKETAQQVYKFLPSPKVISNCHQCPENGLLWIASSSQYFCLSIPRRKQFAGLPYYNLTPVEHLPSTLKLEKDAYDELNNYKKCLIQMADSRNMHAIFFQAYHRDNSHLLVQCLLIPQTKAHDLPFFFKQGLLTSEGDWNTNKSIIEIKKQKGGLLKQIPRNFKYFYIDFSLGYGYAHLIEEEEQKWSDKFAHQILASMLGLEQHQVLTTEEHPEEELEERASQFQQYWRPFDWTALL